MGADWKKKKRSIFKSDPRVSRSRGKSPGENKGTARGGGYTINPVQRKARESQRRKAEWRGGIRQK